MLKGLNNSFNYFLKTLVTFNLNFYKIIFLFQERQYYYLGTFTALSIVQGGCGIPCLATSVYEYVSVGKCSNFEVDPADIPDLALRNTVQMVRQNKQACTTLHKLLLWFPAV